MKRKLKKLTKKDFCKYIERIFKRCKLLLYIFQNNQNSIINLLTNHESMIFQFHEIFLAGYSLVLVGQKTTK